MHTTISLNDGVLDVSLEGPMDPEGVSRSRWKAAVAPAVALLRAWGGGWMLVTHRPGELV